MCREGTLTRNNDNNNNNNKNNNDNNNNNNNNKRITNTQPNQTKPKREQLKQRNQTQYIEEPESYNKRRKKKS